MFLLILFISSNYIYNKKIDTFTNIDIDNIPEDHNLEKITYKENFESLDRNKVKKQNDKNMIIRDVNEEKQMDPRDYSEVFNVLKVLLDNNYFKKNKDNIETLIIDYRIDNLFDLSDKVLNLDNNQRNNNFLEEITCIKNNSIDYLDCDNLNYKKIFAFCELYKVYTLSLEYVIFLINKHKIYKLCDLVDKQYLLKQLNNVGYGYEFDGLMFYINETSISDKYFRILELLKLDDMLYNKNNAISLRERIYNYKDKNKRACKDLNTLVVLFKYYGVFDEYRMNYDEDDYNWDYGILKQVDLNKPYWESNEYFTTYNIKRKIIKTINKLTENQVDVFDHKLNDKYENSVEDDLINESNKTEKNTLDEYKVIEDNNDYDYDTGNKKLIEKLNLNVIKQNLASVFIDIINDIVLMYSKRCNLDCKGAEPSLFNRYNFYFIEIIKIFTKKGRMMYVGILVVIITLIIYFIDISN